MVNLEGVSGGGGTVVNPEGSVGGSTVVNSEGVSSVGGGGG